MTTLLVQRLSDSEPLIQEFSLKINKRYHLGSIAPYIYMHNSPSGSFSFSILNDEDEVIFSKTFTSQDIKESLQTTSLYAHVFKPFIPDSKVILRVGNYKAKLEALSGYSLTTQSFLGWIKQFGELNNEIDFTPIDDLENPLATRMKIYKRGIE